MNPRFRPIRIIGLGLILGAALGLFLGWVVWPTEFTESDPSLLSDRLKEDYALMIATAYGQDGDLATARWRLSTLGLPDPTTWYLQFTVRNILDGGSEADIRQLVRLAQDLGLDSPVLAPYLPQDG